VKRSPDIVATDLGNEVVLLNTRTQSMFTLNATGRLVWYAIEEHDLEEIAAQLEAAFEVERDEAKKDASALIAELRTAGLVHD
jgi:Coenzyme PQQ synthesis protein D (PqqD)